MKTGIFNTEDYSKEQFEFFFSMMSEERKAKCSGYRNAQDRKLCILADYAARKMIEEETGIPAADIVFSKDENGKPQAENIDIQFNYSHSGMLVAVAAGDKPAGIDIEKISEKILKVIPRFACDSEKEFALASEENAAMLWTLKEAYLKAAGTGIKAGLKSVSFTVQNGKITCSDDRYIFTTEKTHGDYIVSTCEMK